MNTNCNIGCDVIMDLVALYKDGLASDETRALVRDHLHVCPDCRRLYAGYRSAERARDVAPTPAPPDTVDYTRIARLLHKQHIRSTAAMVSVFGISLAVGVWSLYKLFGEDSLPSAGGDAH